MKIKSTEKLTWCKKQHDLLHRSEGPWMIQSRRTSLMDVHWHFLSQGTSLAYISCNKTWCCNHLSHQFIPHRSIVRLVHENVFHITGLIHQWPVDSPQRGPGIQSFYIFFAAGPNKPWEKAFELLVIRDVMMHMWCHHIGDVCQKHLSSTWISTYMTFCGILDSWIHIL